MPIYEYRCRECGARVEKIQKFSDPPATACKKCGGKLKRLLSAPAIQFKGSGWYVTDYARKGASEKTTPDGAAAATSDKKEDKSPGSAQTPPSKSSPEK